MKDVLKTKIFFILLMLISVNFIYSGCCCKKKTSNNGSKTKSDGNPDLGKPGNPVPGSHGNPGNPDLGKPGKPVPGNPVGKPEKNPANTKKDGSAHGDGKKSGGEHKGKTSGKGKLGDLTSKPVGSKSALGGTKKSPKVDEEIMKNAIIDGISKYINRTEGTNRSGVKVAMYCGYNIYSRYFFINWNSNCYFYITHSDIDELYSLVQNGRIGDIKVSKMDVRYSEDVNYTFDYSPGFDLKRLFWSLNSLPLKYRPEKSDLEGCDEYLCVRDINDTNIRDMNIYINLRNGVLYSIQAMGGMYRVKINYGKVFNDFTCSFNGKFSSVDNAEKVFNEPLLSKDDIKRFKFVLAK